MSTDFDKIYLNQSKAAGRFRIADSGLGWKTTNATTTKPTQPFLLASDEISSMQWSRGLRGWELKVQTKNEGVVSLDGFAQDDFNMLKNDLQRRFNVVLEHREHSLRGWNWGKTDLARNELVFGINGKPTFEIPYARINNTNLASKNEVAIEFDIHNDKYEPAGDELVEMRFYVPGVVEGTEEGEEEKTAATVLYEELRDKADIGEVAGDAIVSFPDVLFLTPRGRYDIDIYESSIRLRGKTYEYKLQLKHIERIFSLPKADDLHHLMVIQIDPPLRQGQTTYPYLVLQFQKDEETEVELNVEDEEFASKYSDKLKKKYDTKTHIVISHVLKGLTDRRVITPGDFISKFQQAAVSCSLKVNEGHLYPLENAFLFVTKPTVHIPYSEVTNVVISRAGQTSSSSRTFDLEVNLRNNAGSHVFANISKEEQQLLETFLKAKGLRVKNEEREAEHRLKSALNAESEDEDGDINMGSADEDESPDEDFHASDDDEDDDIAEEFDSDAESDSGSEGEEEPPSKKAKH